MTDKLFATGVSIQKKVINGRNGAFEIMKVGIKVDDFVAQLQELKNEKGYANFAIKERRTPGRYGDTHYMEIDEWKQSSQPAPQPMQESDIDVANIPF
jgi:hypothetical protein